MYKYIHSTNKSTLLLNSTRNHIVSLYFTFLVILHHLLIIHLPKPYYYLSYCYYLSWAYTKPRITCYMDYRTTKFSTSLPPFNISTVFRQKLSYHSCFSNTTQPWKFYVPIFNPLSASFAIFLLSYFNDENPHALNRSQLHVPVATKEILRTNTQ